MGAILFETYKDSFETYTKMEKIINFFLVTEQMPRDVALSNYCGLRKAKKPSRKSKSAVRHKVGSIGRTSSRTLPDCSLRHLRFGLASGMATTAARISMNIDDWVLLC